MKLNLHRLSSEDTFSGIYLEAGKVTMNDSIGIADILKINRYRLGPIDTL